MRPLSRNFSFCSKNNHILDYYFIPDWYKEHIDEAAHQLALKRAREEEARAELIKKMAENPDAPITLD